MQREAPAAPPQPPPQTQAASAPAPAAQVTGVPTTGQELRGLRARRSELSRQLSSAASRREELAEELKDADPIARSGLQERIAVLDQRIIQLESDLTETGRQLTAAPAALLGSAESRPPSGSDAADVLTVVGGTIFMVVAAVLVLRFASRIWKGPRPARPALAESAQRLERMEQALDAIAIEVERISEGQRFVTRLLSETSRMPSLASGKREPEPVRTPER